MELYDFIIRISAAVVFGLFIGIERQKTGHPAGVQTNALVCVGACVFQMTAYLMGANDVARIAAQVVTGVGFLGSGIIFRDGINVRGLNTAATIWCGAAIGVLTATGNIAYAAVVTCLILAVNILFQQRTNADGSSKSDAAVTYYNIHITCKAKDVMAVRALLIEQISANKLTLTNLTSEDNEQNRCDITAGLYHTGKRRDAHIEKLTSRLTSEASVVSVKWELV